MGKALAAEAGLSNPIMGLKAWLAIIWTEIWLDFIDSKSLLFNRRSLKIFLRSPYVTCGLKESLSYSLLPLAILVSSLTALLNLSSTDSKKPPGIIILR